MKQSELEQAIASRRPRLLKVAENLVGREAAEDVVQRALADVHAERRWERMDRDALDKWLTDAVQNDCRDHLKALTRSIDHEAEYVERNPHRVIDEDDLIRKVDVERVLARLPDYARRAVWAVYVEGETWEAAAEEVGRPFEALKKEVQRKWWPLLKEQLVSREAPSASLQASEGREEGAR